MPFMSVWNYNNHNDSFNYERRQKMNYAYDIILNFQKDYYDFFEWNKNDEILHIRKIPIFKISNTDYQLFKNSTVKFNKDFVTKMLPERFILRIYTEK